MTKDEVIKEIEDIYAQYEKDGTYAYALVVNKLRMMICIDRESVVETIRCYLLLRHRAMTVIAAWISKDLLLSELKTEIKKIKEEILAGKFNNLPDEPTKYFIRPFEEALKVL